MKRFTHEQKRKLSRQEYIRIASILDRSRRPWRFVLILIAAIALLCWTYTLGLGVVLLVGIVILWVAPQLLPTGASATYGRSPHLREELTFTVSDDYLSVSDLDLYCQCGWRHLAVWRERDGWLILSPSVMPQLFLSVRLLKEAGVYDEVLTLARRHATHYGQLERVMNRSETKC
jgi:hypothetical protein